MPNLIDLTGKRFGRWQVLYKAQPKHSCTSAYWVCKCDCGTIKPVNSQSLRRGDSTSCGCYHKEEFSKMWKTHGKSRTRLYNVWAGMRERCLCNTATAYKWYGEKGITICEEWEDFSAFEKWSLENGYDPTAKTHKCTIDRIDGTKGYSPDNCRWVDSKLQSNNVSSNIRITYGGKSQTLSEWCEELGANYHRTYDRLFRYGWSVEKAFTEPPREWSPGKCKNSE